MCDLKYDFFQHDLDDFFADKRDPGVGRGPARLKFFKSTHPKVEKAEGSGSVLGGPWVSQASAAMDQ